MSAGQWLSFVHLAPAKAEPTRAAAAKAVERAPRTIVAGVSYAEMLCKGAKSSSCSRAAVKNGRPTSKTVKRAQM